MPSGIPKGPTHRWIADVRHLAYPATCSTCGLRVKISRGTSPKGRDEALYLPKGKKKWCREKDRPVCIKKD